MIILRSKNFSKDDGEDKKMRWSDKQNIKRLKKMYNRRKGEEIKDIHLRQMDDDPEVRKQADKDLMKKSAKRVGVLGAAYVPTSAAVGYGAGRLVLKEGRKESAKLAGKTAAHGAAGVAIGAGAGLGAIALDNAVKNKRLKKDDEKYYHKTKDQVKTAAGKMTEEEYTKKWGKTKKRK